MIRTLLLVEKESSRGTSEAGVPAASLVSGVVRRDVRKPWAAISRSGFTTSRISTTTFFEEVRLELLHTDRYRMVQQWTPTVPRPFELVSDEIQYQVGRLEEIKKRLELESRRLGAGDAEAVIPDTNVFLHHVTFNELDWCRILGANRVWLAVPLRVVSELDSRKYARVDDIGKRARTILAKLDELLGNTPRRRRFVPESRFRSSSLSSSTEPTSTRVSRTQRSSIPPRACRVLEAAERVSRPATTQCGGQQ